MLDAVLTVLGESHHVDLSPSHKIELANQLVAGVVEFLEEVCRQSSENVREVVGGVTAEVWDEALKDVLERAQRG